MATNKTVDTPNLSAENKKKLLQLAKAAGLPATTRTSKEDLVGMLEAHLAEKAAEKGKGKSKPAPQPVVKEHLPSREVDRVAESQWNWKDSMDRSKSAQEDPERMWYLRRLAGDVETAETEKLLKNEPIQGVGVIFRDDGNFVGLQAKYHNSSNHRQALRQFKKLLAEKGLTQPDPRSIAGGGATPKAKDAEETQEVVENEEEISFDEMTKAELLEYAEEIEVSVAKRASKVKIIEAIEAAI